MNPTAVGNVLLVVGFVLLVAFVVSYQLLADWWRTEMGQNEMAVRASMAGVLGLGVVRLIFGASLDVHWFAWLRVALFAVLVATLGWRLSILLRVQLRQRR